MSPLQAIASAGSTTQHAAGHDGAWIVGILIAVQIAMLVFSLWWLHREDSPGDDPGDGGGGGSGKPPPQGPPPSDEPAWWPEFERDFAAYAAGRSSPDRVGA